MALKWNSFADQICDIATRIYGYECKRAIINHIAMDGIIDVAPDYSIAVLSAAHLSASKLQAKTNQLAVLKKQYASEGKYLKCFLVARGEPSAKDVALSEGQGVILASVSSFAAGLINFDAYHQRRLSAPFGSAVDPRSGEIDRISYVPVSYIDKSTNQNFTSREVANQIADGKIIILLGEYGSGKSRCISEVYQILAKEWGETFRFPFAINLRECWGMQTAEELLRRHTHLLGLDDLASSAVRVFQRDSGMYLLDGFDEVGSQAWTIDEAKLKALRAQAMSGVRDTITRSGAGCLVAGREHYFSSRDEMIAALGVSDKNFLVLHVNEEFTAEQMESYFDAADVSVVLPEWLPRRPLICQTIANLESDEITRMFAEQGREAEFWNHFIDIVCKRDARISPSFDDSTIMQVYIELARKSRNKPMNVGPFSQRDLQDAFELAVGQPPTEDASVMLQRLPSLGRIGAESTDRQFIDMYILDGLRGRDIARLPEITEDRRRWALDEQWMNPLGVLGQRVLAEAIRSKPDQFRSLMRRASEARNAIVASDIVSAFLHDGSENIEYSGIEIINGTFADLDLSLANALNLVITDSIFEKLTLPSAPPKGTTIKRSSAGAVIGASAKSGLPSWIELDTVDEFDSVQTVARIRNAGLDSQHEILVAIVKKTFFQKGSGRKEEALLRGFGGGQSQKTASKILNLLLREKVLTTFKGNEGNVYAPVRSEAGRMDLMLKELRSSTDEIWSKAAQI